MRNDTVLAVDQESAILRKKIRMYVAKKRLESIRKPLRKGGYWSEVA